ncbi:glycosyltransferase [Candidatus Woesebacteria bacterium]|nr:glycosyltransferase [Candidatus Woesebacteria bacterium]
MPAAIDIIIPVKNEEQSLTALVARIHQALSSRKISYSIIVVDDQSTDNTVQELKSLAKTFPLKWYRKKGKPGKAFSILEGAAHATAPYIAMIDADLQYPPEVLPDMIELTQQYGVVVARRQIHEDSWLRKAISSGFRLFFGKVLYGLNCDVQSGLKVFRRDIIKHVRLSDVSPWTLDIPLLHTALELGYTIGEVEIEFAARQYGESKIKLFQSIREIGGHALSYRLKQKPPLRIEPANRKNMTGAGVILKNTQFITHTTLEHDNSAVYTTTATQRAVIAALLLATLLGILSEPFTTAKILVALLSTIYFIDVLFNLLLILRSLRHPPEITIDEKAISQLDDTELPTYTILCPLYKEAHVLPFFLQSISKMDWPKHKLEVLLLLEKDDRETVEAALNMQLPSYVKVLVVPDSQPKTKPKACNFGLNHATGEYLVIYDAEDMPDPLQLKKVYLAFKQEPAHVRCIQAKLNYFNPHQNLLTRFFTAEYSLWFDVILTGLQSINTTIPLGGTSNHFRTKDLLTLKGWDPFNVTEDADLGIRLFKLGAQTAIIDSVTLEEANSDFHNWLRQRSRWIKGYMQTYLVHMRHPLTFLKENGVHALVFHLSMGGKIAFLFINPLMWVLTIGYFAAYAILGPAIEALYPTSIFYMAAFSLVFGNFMFMYYYMIGVAKREHWPLMKFVLCIPVYWLMVSIAACIALYQLIFKPHYWEKTIHGLHLKKAELEEKLQSEQSNVVPALTAPFIPVHKPTRWWSTGRLRSLMSTRKVYLSGILLIGTSFVASLLNLVFNAYMGRTLPLATFGLLNLVNSFVYLAGSVFQAVGTTISERVGYISGHSGNRQALVAWQTYRPQVSRWALAITAVWIALTPLLMFFFEINDPLPFLVIAPTWMFGLLLTLDRSYFSSNLQFSIAAGVTLIEAISKLVIGVTLANSSLQPFVYIALPISLYLPFLVSRLSLKHKINAASIPHHEIDNTARFSLPFFGVSTLAGFSTMAFLSLDTVWIAHLLTPDEVGQYGLVALVGKMVFFLGSLAHVLLVPLVSNAHGAKRPTEKMLWLMLGGTAMLHVMALLGYELIGGRLLPIVLNKDLSNVAQLMPLYIIGISFFSLSRVFVQYHLTRRVYGLSIASAILIVFELIAMSLFVRSVADAVTVVSFMGIAQFIMALGMHIALNWVVAVQNNTRALVKLFWEQHRAKKPPQKGLRILFFNWRDTKHTWAGGAETYIHELGKELVSMGNQVTVFCGNDGHSSEYDRIDGIEIYRRGGFFTVYIWAALYYLFRFRGKYDCVVDCENGIPFFVPLFSTKPVFLLIHHVHQEVFREHLPFPLSLIAQSMEAWLMPLVYRNKPIITVSDSSKQAIKRLGWSEQDISVINPGITISKPTSIRKSTRPLICYVGRLKPYKNIDILIKAFALVREAHPNAQLVIAGSGESRSSLERLATKLGIGDQVNFTGRVSEKEKAEILTRSWVVVQPSMIEGWGITVLEANACGTPVIASNVPGLRDSVVDGKTGLLVTPRNIGELESTLLNVLGKNKLRNKLSLEAVNWAQRFSWQIAAQQWSKQFAQQVIQAQQQLSHRNTAHSPAISNHKK